MTKKKKRKGTGRRTETKENLEAFKMYCKLSDNGADDIFDKIADKFSKQKKTIYNWSSVYGWKERHETIVRKANERALERLTQRVERQNIRVLDKLINNLQMAEDGVIGSIDGEYSVTDYEKLIKLFRLLTNETTENNKSEVEYTLSESDTESLVSMSKNKANDIMNVKLEINNERKEE